MQVPAEGFKYLLNLWRNFKSDEDRIGLYRNWPGEEIYELLAIAQHHGLPTRLLDFTHNPFKAVFFAVKDQQNEARAAEESNSQVIIWALQRFRAYFDRYVEISVPRSLNVNINSQEGLFLLDKQANIDLDHDIELGQNVVVRDIEEFLNLQCLDYQVKNKIVYESDFPYANKFVLPISERNRALVILNDMGINQAMLMPSYDNVAATLRFMRDEGIEFPF